MTLVCEQFHKRQLSHQSLKSTKTKITYLKFHSILPGTNELTSPQKPPGVTLNPGDQEPLSPQMSQMTGATPAATWSGLTPHVMVEWSWCVVNTEKGNKKWPGDARSQGIGSHGIYLVLHRERERLGKRYMNQVTKEQLSCYLVLLSNDSKIR